MKLGVLHPEALVDIGALRARARRHPRRRGRAAPGRAGAHGGGRRPSGRASATIPVLAQSLQLAASRSCATWPAWRARCCSAPGALLPRAELAAVQQAQPGTGCAAIAGCNRHLAVLGTSEHCIAHYPGDFANALAASAPTWISGPAGDARPAAGGAAPPAGRHPARRDRAAPGRARSPASTCRRGPGPPLALPEGARPRVLRLRAGLCRRGARSRRCASCARRASGWAGWPPSLGVAREAERSLQGRRLDEAAAAEAAPMPSATPSPIPKHGSSPSSAAAPWCAPCSPLPRWRTEPCPTIAIAGTR